MALKFRTDFQTSSISLSLSLLFLVFLDITRCFHNTQYRAQHNLLFICSETNISNCYSVRHDRDSIKIENNIFMVVSIPDTDGGGVMRPAQWKYWKNWFISYGCICICIYYFGWCIKNSHCNMRCIDNSHNSIRTKPWRLLSTVCAISFAVFLDKLNRVEQSWIHWVHQSIASFNQQKELCFVSVLFFFHSLFCFCRD